jgi:hypothetical protein
MSARIRALAGAGILPALIASTMGGDQGMQWIMFAWAASWGGLWMLHD